MDSWYGVPFGNFSRIVATAMGTLLTWLAVAQGEPVRFADHVAPIFRSRCCHCHGDDVQKAELNLASVAGIRQGSESGPILQPNEPLESRLWQVVRDGEMPPEDEGEPLSQQEVEILRRWIEQGADLATTADSLALDQHAVLPILLLRCATCHGRQQQEAGLDVRTKASLLQGGKSGPAIVPGKPTESLLIKMIVAENMPPRSKLASHSVKPVEPHELATLVAWIEQGAPQVETPPDVATTAADPLVSDADRGFWSFQPPRSPAVPALVQFVPSDVAESVDVGEVADYENNADADVDLAMAGASRPPSPSNPIDAFVLARLREVGLGFTRQASAEGLVRRAYFDLLGLPPSPEEVEAFVASTDPGEYERLIDRLLASPRYGERWGQFWLDLAGYSDSEGVQHSDPIRPHAYRYRDYVIRALNADKPYDRFLLEQIAGDELADYEHAEVITDALYDNLAATGFLRMSADGTFAGITGFVPNRLDVIDDQLRILSSAVMGLTVRCARCHSHKFDPIPQRDYYRLVALLKPAMDEHDWLKPITGGDGNSAGQFRYLHQVTTAERLAWERQDGRLRAAIGELQSQLRKRPNDVEFKQAAEEKIKSLEARRTPEPMIRALWDRGQPSPTYLLRRGDYLQPTRLVGPGVPSVLTSGRTPFTPQPPWPGAKKTGNRLALAKWLVLPDHPLTARVLVNRVWKHHFGRGIVATLDDFGRAGAKPSHPNLLDWLAVELVRRDWSIKQLHRLIMTSATYRQASIVGARRQRLDPDNMLLSRMPLRRMEAEVLRDSLLAVTGRLDLTPFGPPDEVTARDDGLTVSSPKPTGRRRSIYVLKRRTQPLTILDNFDRPAMSPNCVERTVSTVAPQALHLMNNRMVHELSEALAERLLAEVGTDRRRQIERLYLLVAGRKPRPDEMAAMLDAFGQLRMRWRERQPSSALDQPADQRALGNLCHALLNSATFLYVE